MTHSEYLNKMLTYSVQENSKYWSQCVALVKDYCNKVHKAPLGSFNGNAKDAKFGQTFPSDKYWLLIPGKDDLKQGDIVIQEFMDTGHTGIVIRSNKDGYYLLEQNNGELDKNTPNKWGNGDGKANDAILVRHYTRGQRRILQMYRKIPK